MESSDRMKLKDKIIDNISKAIKSIQELLYYQSKDPVLAESVVSFTLCNGDSACHKLCENLDHALLHGLKKITHGYWQVVKQLSHKQTVREIEILTNVTTELGKGRAWLYASLNEGNLESYIRLLCDNEKLLKKYYAKEALMLDEDRMNILLTHTSGLECVHFQLEYDVPYLDLSAYPPRNFLNSHVEASVTSSLSQYRSRFSNVRSKEEFQTGSLDPTSDSDSASNVSFDTYSHSDIVYQMKSSTISSDSGCHTDGTLTDGAKQQSDTETVFKQQSSISTDTISLSSVGSSGDSDRLRRLESIIPSGEDEENGGDSFQVIRIKNKKVASKSKKKKPLQPSKSDSDKNSIITAHNNEFHYQETSEVSNGEDILSRDEFDSVRKVNDKISFENDSAINCENLIKNSTACDSQPVSQTGLTSISKFDSGIDICDTFKFDNDSSHQSTNVTNQGSMKDKEQLSSSPHSQSNSKTIKAQIENKVAEFCNVDNSSHRAKSPELKSNNTFIPDNIVKNSSDNLRESNQPNHVSNSPAIEFHSSHCQNSQNKKTLVKQHNLFNSSKHKNAGKAEDKESVPSNQEVDENFDVYSSNKYHGSRKSSGEHSPSELAMNNSSVQSATKLKDYMDYILKTPDSPPMDSKYGKEARETEADLSLSLDNNTKLQLMLDIFTQEDEQLLKMFVTRENYPERDANVAYAPERDANVVYVLISTQCLYLLKYRHSTKKFVMQSMAMLQDLLFISTGINEQTLNIESIGKNNQKQRFWLAPGHQALTLTMVTCLTEAVKAASEYILPANSRFSVESEVPMQTIVLRKYISAELHCETQDVTISDYSLVYWEDPSFPNNADAAFKEGTLFLRSQDQLKTHVWKLVYVVLKNSMLCVSNKKSDPRPFLYLGLGGDQCVGCRLTSTTDRAHCIELILAQGGSWFLAAASQKEISEWRHALCLAVSQGTVENNTLSDGIPCGSVLSCNHLFLCHEDIHTKFYRTLGRARLEDITGIACEENSTYCVIEFESQESGILSNYWVLYFSSTQDLQRFSNALSSAWMEIYQIELPISKIHKASLHRHCSAISDQLKRQLTCQ